MSSTISTMINSGHSYADPNAMGPALIQAATEAGIRLTLIDVCYLAGGLAASGHLPLDPLQAPLRRPRMLISGKTRVRSLEDQ